MATKFLKSPTLKHNQFNRLMSVLYAKEIESLIKPL